MSKTKLLATGLLGFSLFSLGAAQDAKAPRVPSYGVVMQGNAAAEFTTDDYITRGYLVGDQQYVSAYSLSSPNATVAIKGMGLNWIAAWKQYSWNLDSIDTTGMSEIINLGLNSGVSEAIFEVAKSESFGLGISLSFNKIGIKMVPDSGDESSGKMVFSPDRIKLFGSLNTGFGGIYGELGTSIGDSGYFKTTFGDEVQTYSNRLYSVLLGWVLDSKGEMSPTIGVYINTILNGISNKQKDPDSTIVEKGSFTTILSGQYGIPLKKSDDFGVYLGTSASTSFYTWSQSEPEGEFTQTNLTFNIRPNVSFQKVLPKGFEALCGGSFNLVNWASIGVKDTNDNKGSASFLQTAAPNANIGLRWSYENFAVEGVLATSILNNGPYLISGKETSDGMFGQIGVSVGF